jgi:hypothetical protein
MGFSDKTRKIYHNVLYRKIQRKKELSTAVDEIKWKQEKIEKLIGCSTYRY